MENNRDIATLATLASAICTLSGHTPYAKALATLRLPLLGTYLLFTPRTNRIERLNSLVGGSILWTLAIQRISNSTFGSYQGIFRTSAAAQGTASYAVLIYQAGLKTYRGEGRIKNGASLFRRSIALSTGLFRAMGYREASDYLKFAEGSIGTFNILWTKIGPPPDNPLSRARSSMVEQ